MVTIIDIAKECGVSVATVSYALNGKGHISNEMRLRIQEVAQKMNYVPSQAARNLQKGKSNVVSVIIPDITTFFNNQVFEFLEKKVNEYNLQVIVGCSLDKETLENELFEKMVSQMPLGIIWFPSTQTTEHTFECIDKILQSNKIPALAVYKKIADTQYLKYVEWDIQNAVRQITGYLLDAGLKNTLFFGPKECGGYLTFKHKGYRQAFKERNMQAPALLCDMEQTYSDAKQYTLSFLEKNKKLPQAIVAVNDIAAYGIVSALEERGVCVPQQISVVGIDGIRFDYANHKMTTITPDLQLLADKCVDIIYRFDKYPQKVYGCQNHIIKGTTSI